MAKRDFDKEFGSLVGEQPSVEDLQEKASHPDIQFWVGRKVFRLGLFESNNPEAAARYRVLMETETREQLVPIFRELGVSEESAELVIGLAEDIAKQNMEAHGY